MNYYNNLLLRINFELGNGKILIKIYIIIDDDLILNN